MKNDKLWLVAMTVAGKKGQSANSTSGYISATDFWDANKIVVERVKDGKINVLECKITEVNNGK